MRDKLVLNVVQSALDLLVQNSDSASVVFGSVREALLEAARRDLVQARNSYAFWRAENIDAQDGIANRIVEGEDPTDEELTEARERDVPEKEGAWRYFHTRVRSALDLINYLQKVDGKPPFDGLHGEPLLLVLEEQLPLVLNDNGDYEPDWMRSDQIFRELLGCALPPRSQQAGFDNWPYDDDLPY